MKAMFALPLRAARDWVACLMLCVAAINGWAQASEPPPVVADPGKSGGSQEQRRAALRAALKAQRDAASPKPDRAVRQLTPAERAKLREQLRHQRRDAPPGRNGQ